MTSDYFSGRLQQAPRDEIQEIVARVANDERAHKIDLGIGVYRAPNGNTHLFDTVAEASRQVTDTFEPRGYLPQRGDAAALDLLADLVFGSSAQAFASIQTVGGTGAVRLALELSQVANPDASVHVGTPTWSNHIAISERLGLRVATYTYYDVGRGQVTDQARELANFGRGDVLVMHGPCHNPTGADLDLDTRLDLVRQLNEAGGCLLLDLAYYGLGEGLSQDLTEVREVVNAAQAVTVAVSCSKAFGLYGERTGALFVKSESPAAIPIIQSNLELITRQTTSSTPRFGAEIVRTILSDTDLKSRWKHELEDRRRAIYSIRTRLAEALEFWSRAPRFADHRGIFSVLPISDAQIRTIGERHAIHMPMSGRINVTGLTGEAVSRFAAAVEETV